MDPFKNRGEIHYSYIVTAFIAFILGVLGTIVVKNGMTDEEITFSTIDIINLVFTVGASVASIVLAITAIILSKKSEDTILMRSDESIKHQTGIFNETIAVLGEIKTSTGVSEKRIEDIAQQIQQVQKRKPGPESKDEQIKGILRETFEPNLYKRSVYDSKSIDNEQTKFTKEVMDILKRNKDLQVVKVGSGDFDKLGDDMVDGIFSKDGKRFSVSTFYIHGSSKIASFAASDTFKQYFVNLASEIVKGTFEKSILVFNKDADADKEFKALFSDTLKVLDAAIAKKIILVSGSLSEINKMIVENLDSKA